MLQNVAVRCSVSQCVAVCLHLHLCSDSLSFMAAERHHKQSVRQAIAECCSVLQCVAVCCSMLQCAALCCAVLQCAFQVSFRKQNPVAALQAVQHRCSCCSVLQCVAACCSKLQRAAVCSSVLSRSFFAKRPCNFRKKNLQSVDNLPKV